MNEPDKMRFWIGGYGACAHELEYDGVALQYRSFNTFDPRGDSVVKTIPANQDAWENFRHELDSLGVWDWQPKYWNEVMDSTQWEFKLQWEYRTLNIVGSNCYPESDGSPSDSCEYTRTFRRFLNALGRLTGGMRIE